MSEIIELLRTLVSYESVTPEDKGCQEFMIHFLERIGFKCQRFNKGPVANFFAVRGDSGPLLVFAGHTDVVPVGDASKWQSNPFQLHEQNDTLYGRGVADMKGSLACMLLMAERFVNKHPLSKARLGFLITSGEEGDDYHLGTPYVMEQLTQLGIHIDYCIVGEPSSTKVTGDVLKVGRRGSLNGKLTLHGKQGHVAYPHLAQNPIHSISPILADLSTRVWDKGNEYFPPTSMQVTHIHSGGHATNIIPGELELALNFRFSNEQNEQSLKQAVEQAFALYELYPVIEWRLSGEPFLTSKGRLLESCLLAIQNHTHKEPELSTTGGTSDGRFIAPYGVQVIELGPENSSIHQVNESVSLKNLILLESIYFSITEELLT